MNERTGNAIALACMAAIHLSTARAQELNCDVGNFKSTNVGALSDVQQLSYLSLLSKAQFEDIKKEGSASGSYGLISGSADYAEFRQKATKHLEYLKIDNFSSYQKSWAESALDAEGLKGYLGCLQARGGFHVGTTSLGEDLSQLSVVWGPGLNGDLKSVPRIVDPHNVANLPEITKLFGNTPWRNQAKNLTIPLRKTNPQIAADLTIATDNQAQTVYLPPRSVLVGRPTPTMKLSWGNSTSQIIQPVPPEALGGFISLKVHAEAFSKRSGTIWINVDLDAVPGGTRQQCASPVYTQSYNMAADLVCSFQVPYGAQRVTIDAGNLNADARSIRAEVSY
jgi:hypothetical protein